MTAFPDWLAWALHPGFWWAAAAVIILFFAALAWLITTLEGDKDADDNA